MGRIPNFSLGVVVCRCTDSSFIANYIRRLYAPHVHLGEALYKYGGFCTCHCTGNPIHVYVIYKVCILISRVGLLTELGLNP